MSGVGGGEEFLNDHTRAQNSAQEKGVGLINPVEPAFVLTSEQC